MRLSRHLGPVLCCLKESLPPLQPRPRLPAVAPAHDDDGPPAGLDGGQDLVHDGQAGQEVPGVDTAGVGGAGGGGGALQLLPQLSLHPAGLTLAVGDEHIVYLGPSLLCTFEFNETEISLYIKSNFRSFTKI